MSFLKSNVCLIIGVTLLSLFSVMPDAFAATNLPVANVGNKTVFDVAMTKGSDTFEAVKSVIFLVGGFGLVALAFFAVFGKLKWTWFASLAVGLAILAAAGAVIDFATTSGGTGGVGSEYFDDTLTGNSTQSFSPAKQ